MVVFGRSDLISLDTLIPVVFALTTIGLLVVGAFVAYAVAKRTNRRACAFHLGMAAAVSLALAWMWWYLIANFV